jgi:hypothetical protein
MTADNQWDFYPCRIDEIEASILLNFRYEHESPPANATTLYRIRLPMREPEDHGMGSAGEASAMNMLEDALVERAEAGELLYVARIRSRADWELVFYGAPGRSEALQAVRDVFGDRRTYVDVRPDPTWGFYCEFLLPDEERQQWMADRRLVQVLADQGDNLAKPRRVDHWAHFPTADGRDRFVQAAQQTGFELQRAAKVENAELPFGAQVYRSDSVELAHIHEVVMELVELAEREQGDYGGWEASVEMA